MTSAGSDLRLPAQPQSVTTHGDPLDGIKSFCYSAAPHQPLNRGSQIRDRLIASSTPNRFCQLAIKIIKSTETLLTTAW